MNGRRTVERGMNALCAAYGGVAGHESACSGLFNAESAYCPL